MLTNNVADITEKLMRSRASKLKNYVLFKILHGCK